MKKHTFKITYFVRKARTSKTGLAPILARITVDGVRQEVYIKCSVDPKRWNQTKERDTGKDMYAAQVNLYLDEYRAKVLEVWRQLQNEGCDGTVYEIKHRLQTSNESARQFLAEFETYCQKRQKEADGKFITQLTANKYHRLLRYMKEYTAEEYKKNDLPLSAVNNAYLDGLNVFVQTRHNCKNNGAVNLLCCLKNFMLFCERNEWIEKNPFQRYKLKMERNKEKEHLEASELDLLIATKMPNKHLEATRDVFAFCCMTGLAFTDAFHLQREHLVRDENGNMWIIKPREKTGVTSQIPLLPYPRQILDKYASDPDCRAKDRLLPVACNQRMNTYLKVIATICNFDKNLSTHCARHTFACVAIEYGMPIDVIAKILGHNNVNMTRHYAKFSKSKIYREMFKLGQKIQVDSGKLKADDLKKAQ